MQSQTPPGGTQSVRQPWREFFFDSLRSSRFEREGEGYPPPQSFLLVAKFNLAMPLSAKLCFLPAQTRGPPRAVRGLFSGMSTLQEIEAAVEALPPADFDGPK
jgi:hypothetical protein